MPSRSFPSSLVCLLLATASSSAQDADLAQHIEIDKLRKHVTYLASPELEGRRDGAGIEKARVYIVDLFRKAGLQPKGTKGYMQAFGSKGMGRNIIGFLPGHDPRLKHEIIVISAHYDALGKRGKLLFPGANDNASGVAAMLEVARVLHERKVKLKRSLLFISFDQEERWLIGSTHFVAKPTVPLKDITLCINFDMLGRNLADVIRGYVFVLGAEHSPSLGPVVKQAARGLKVKAGLIGTDLIGVRGHYGPFRALDIPYLFLSNGEHSAYHQPTDTAAGIIYPKLLASTQLIMRTVASAANLPARPVFREPTPSVDEARAFVDVLDQLIPQGKMFGVKGVDLRGEYPKGKEFYWWAFSSTTKQLETLINPMFLGTSGTRTVFLIEALHGVDIERYSAFLLATLSIEVDRLEQRRRA